VIRLQLAQDTFTYGGNETGDLKYLDTKPAAVAVVSIVTS